MVLPLVAALLPQSTQSLNHRLVCDCFYWLLPLLRFEGVFGVAVLSLLICIRPQLNFVVFFFFHHIHTAQRVSLSRSFGSFGVPMTLHTSISSHCESCRMSFSFLAQWISCLMFFSSLSSSPCRLLGSMLFRKVSNLLTSSADSRSCDMGEGRKSFDKNRIMLQLFQLNIFRSTTRVTSDVRGGRELPEKPKDTSHTCCFSSTGERQWKHFSHHIFFCFPRHIYFIVFTIYSKFPCTNITVDSLHWPLRCRR